MPRLLSTLLIAAACSLPLACSSDGDDDDYTVDNRDSRLGERGDLRLPRGANRVAETRGNQPLRHRTVQPGMIFLVDATTDMLLHQQRLETGQTFSFNPETGRGNVGRNTVFSQALSSDHEYQLFFLRDSSN